MKSTKTFIYYSLIACISLFGLSGITPISIANAQEIETYELASNFEVPVGTSFFDSLPDGKLIAVVNTDLYQETAAGSRDFELVGAIPNANFPFGSGFLSVSPNGERFAVGNNLTGASAQVGVFTVSSLEGDWFNIGHFEAAWHNEQWLLVTDSGTEVLALDTLSLASSPNILQIIVGIGGFSGGISFDSASNLYVGNGFDTTSTGSETGSIKAFPASQWLPILSGGSALDFELEGQLIVDLLSAASLNFDVFGNFLVGGGDVFGGSGDNNYFAIVSSSALDTPLDGGIEIDPTDAERVRRDDPDTVSASNSYVLSYNSELQELYVRDVFGSSLNSVFVYSISALDDCPDDPEKSEAGVCGCGIPDSDQDNDGVLDCNDLCPNDSAKQEPETCGCGEIDFQNEGQINCNPLNSLAVLAQEARTQLQRIRVVRASGRKARRIRRNVRQNKKLLRSTTETLISQIETISILFVTSEEEESFRMTTEELVLASLKATKTGRARFRKNKRRALKLFDDFALTLGALT